MTKHLHVALAALAVVVGATVAGVGLVLKVTHDLGWALLVPGVVVAAIGLAVASSLDRDSVSPQ